MDNVAILIVEDEENQRNLLLDLLRSEGYSAEGAENGEIALDKFERDNFDVVLLDMRLPDLSGIEILEKLKEKNPVIPVIIITAYANVKNAVNAMKEGAFHYLTKPVDDEELLAVIEKAVDNLNLKRENRELKNSLLERYKYEKIIYNSDEMEEVMSLVFRAAKSNANVMITGGSGTGKELIAGAIHNLSRRNNKNFVVAHLAALPQGLIESELFGHEKGAFTGADRQRKGKFEYASGGSLFLDEIGELPGEIQVKLLRVIQEQKIVRLGSNKEIEVDVRLISATNKDIENEIEEGNFREDLYYRLNVIRIHIPPLRERKEDIPVLVNHFVSKHSRREGKEIKGFTDKAMKKIVKYDFPGNVRELENIVKSAIVFTRSNYIGEEELPEKITETRVKRKGKLNETVEDLEKNMIIDALKQNNWNQSAAASELGISERVIRYKMGKYDIENPQN